MKPKPVMLILRYLICIGLVFCFVEGKRPASPDRDIFAGATPCDAIIRPMLAIPAAADCELVKWQLLLLKGPEDDKAVRFDLKYTYGMSKAGTQGFVNDGTSAEMNGKWIARKKEGNLPGQALIQLQPTENKPISFAKLDDNIVHLLDPEGKLMIGNAAWSYTLNRIETVRHSDHH
ncbi:hypothetical protein [Dyadobacter pollutisoli]|jgi:hypothetical protein|uniref:Copper resistance protein NlpE n=1 Tax=Dyadobacter pollutisoli TaxID=2910158 RepID=A0A9E8NHF6_9BACT|nr:hypothetical protein [Dyadobacter pollutisoli]WAC14109.1 hypothetical protein ON006_09120 [Dyadobacter pollutisoli]